MPQVDSHPGGGATPSQVEFLGGGEGLAEVLGGRGWEVSRIQDEIRVTFSSPRFFKQVSIIERGGGGLLREMELASTAEWSKVSFEAAAALILRTNERLRLARIVCDFTGDRRLLLAQVHLGRLPVNSPWIDTALDSLRATATLVAEPLPALAEGVLARQVLQASCCGSATHP